MDPRPTSSSYTKQLATVLPKFVSLYKPLANPLTTIATGLRANYALQNLLSNSTTYEGKWSMPDSPQVLRAAVEVSAFAATLFAHPAGLLITASQDLLKNTQSLLRQLEHNNYSGAKQIAAQLLSNALCLMACTTASYPVIAAYLSTQALLGLYHANKAYNQGENVEALGHLVISLLQASTLAAPLTKTLRTRTIAQEEKPVTYTTHYNTAQYKNADYSSAVRFESGISLEEAKQIADADPSIKYFFRVKGGRMVLETSRENMVPQDYQYWWQTIRFGNGIARVFYHGDTVFFTNNMWLGSAPDLADTFSKN